MKKLIYVLFIGVFIISCSSDSSSSSSGLSDTPLAKAEFDNSNFGIYKGVFVGSSGVMTLNIKNDGNINATLILDSVKYNFTTTGTVAADQNIQGLTFTSGNMSFVLDISGNGENIDVTALNFPGHDDATLNLTKEYSDALVKCYEGTHSGTSSGTLNVIISDDYVSGLSFSPDNDPDTDDDAAFLSGTLNGTILSGTYGDDQNGGTFNGTLSGNTISGQWQSNDAQNPASGTWTCRRTL